jgi:hypothetical protein
MDEPRKGENQDGRAMKGRSPQDGRGFNRTKATLLEALTVEVWAQLRLLAKELFSTQCQTHNSFHPA